MEAIALMADIHANLPAAEAVIADIRRKHKPDRRSPRQNVSRETSGRIFSFSSRIIS